MEQIVRISVRTVEIPPVSADYETGQLYDKEAGLGKVLGLHNYSNINYDHHFVFPQLH